MVVSQLVSVEGAVHIIQIVNIATYIFSNLGSFSGIEVKKLEKIIS